MSGKNHVIARNAQHFDPLRWIAFFSQTLFRLLSVLAHGSTHPRMLATNSDREPTAVPDDRKAEGWPPIRFSGVLQWYRTRGVWTHNSHPSAPRRGQRPPA